ncbi:MAG: hypothetical protein MUF16_04175 [Burkholderiaceae bacterium]|jgi:hypothetical protein|nr:hypothetical protein [Burkholderiaceae bacterium]
MSTCRALVLTGIALGGLPLIAAGQTQLVRIPLPSKPADVRQLVAPPLDFIEVCTGLKTRRALTWQFEAEHALGFNIHLHRSGNTPPPPKGAALSTVMSAAKGRLVPSSDHEHCWMWANPSLVPVTIRLQLDP